MFDCPVRLVFFGPNDPAERDRIEKALKADKLVKATQLKHTKKEAEAARVTMGLTGAASYGIGSEETIVDKMAMKLEDLIQKSDLAEFRRGGDAIKTFAIDEDYLSRMPLADQPTQLASSLLPYQLQVSPWRTLQDLGAKSANTSAGPCVDDLQGKSKAAGQQDGPACAAVGAERRRQVLQHSVWICHPVAAHALLRRYSFR